MTPCDRRLLSGFPVGHVLRRRYFCKQSIDVGQPTPATHPQLLKDGEITPGITAVEYASRRKRLLDLLPEKSLGIIASAPVKMMTDVVPYTFRQESDYAYLTGCVQPGGIAVLGREFGLCMFMPEPEPHDVAWHGRLAGVDAAFDLFKADRALPLGQLHKILPDMIKAATGNVFQCERTVKHAYSSLGAFQDAESDGRVKDISRYTHELRWLKSVSEIKLMKESARIASEALVEVMRRSRNDCDEGKLAAIVEYECRMRGAQRMAFNPVVGGGSNASVIHYSRNDREIRNGELVLMDVGCELHGYVSDLSRTWSPSRALSSSPQRDLYGLILETNKECLRLCKPGISLHEINAYSAEKLMRGFEELGILKDGPRGYHHLNPTSVGHYVGMDVHDSSTISIGRPLLPGVVITIEPGVYIPLDFSCPEWFRGAGMRIEDEVLITETGCDVLTSLVPKEIEDLDGLPL